MIEQTSIKEIKGVGEKTQKLFEKVGIFTVGDLIRYYPRGYDVYEEAIPISEVEEGHMQMGVLDVSLSELIAQMDGSYSLYGENFTKSSKVYVNGEKQKTTFLNNTRIDILDTEIKEGDTIEVSQVGSSNRIFRTSKQYIYQGGKLVEAPDTAVDQTEGTTTENTEQ